jgi:hypothetical protein
MLESPAANSRGGLLYMRLHACWNNTGSGLPGTRELLVRTLSLLFAGNFADSSEAQVTRVRAL